MKVTYFWASSIKRSKKTYRINFIALYFLKFPSTTRKILETQEFDQIFHRREHNMFLERMKCN